MLTGLRCAPGQVLRRLDNVDASVKEFFAPAAKLVLESEDPQNAMCAALAALSGMLEVPKPRRCAARLTY
jgi:ATP-dependent RNA helicase DDX21